MNYFLLIALILAAVISGFTGQGFHEMDFIIIFLIICWPIFISSLFSGFLKEHISPHYRGSSGLKFIFLSSVFSVFLSSPLFSSLLFFTTQDVGFVESLKENFDILMIPKVFLFSTIQIVLLNFLLIIGSSFFSFKYSTIAPFRLVLALIVVVGCISSYIYAFKDYFSIFI